MQFMRDRTISFLLAVLVAMLVAGPFIPRWALSYASVSLYTGIVVLGMVLMMRTGLRMLGVHSSEAAMIGDRMDTDIVAGVESGLDSVLVLSGVTTIDEMKRFPYRPRLVLDGVGDIPV